MNMIVDHFVSKLRRVLPIASKVLLGVVVVVLLAVAAMTILPERLNASASHVEEKPVDVPVIAAVEPVKSAPQVAPAPVVDTGVDFDPLINGMGGTCITGSVIDVYHQNAGEGWKITVTPPEGDPISQVTGPDGTYKFENLGAGKHKVEIEIRVGWRAFTVASFEVVMSGDEKDGCATTRFKMEALPCLIVKKQDANGQMGLEKPVGLADWAITVKLGSRTETQRTNSNGFAEFRYLVPGIWSVEEESKTGWMPVLGQTSSVELTSPRTPYTCTDVVLVNTQLHTSCIAVYKVEKKGDQEIPLKDWKMTITRNDGTRKADVTEDSTKDNGYVFFSDLDLGEWTITEEVYDGWRNLTPISQSVTLENPTDFCPVVKFVNERLCRAEGFKINHFDQGLDHWPIIATSSTGIKKWTLTDDTGYFRFDNLECGEWTFEEDITFVDPDKHNAIQDPRVALEWTPVTPSRLTFTLVPEVVQEMRFKNRAAKACIDAYKMDSAGAPLADWEMTVTARHNGQFVTSGKTLGNGIVEFIVNPGDYVVGETLKPMWEPMGPLTQDVTVEATGFCEMVVFENRQTPPYGSDDPAEPESTIVVGGEPATPTPASPCCSSSYTIRSGDTLFGISQTFGVSVDALRTANQITGNLIYPGTVLCIP